MSSTNQPKDNYTSKIKFKSTILLIVCILLTIICLVPIYLLIVNATRSDLDISSNVSFLPGSYMFKNLEELNKNTDFAAFDAIKGFRNSGIIAIGATVLSVFFSALTAYGIYVYDFKLKSPAYTFILAVMMVPMQVTSVGFLDFMCDLELDSTFIPLIVPALAAPAIVFFMRQYLQSSFPLDIVEAARIDGCGEFRTFLTIAIPMMKPAIAVQSIFAFIANWNNFYMPSMILIDGDYNKFTMPMMINALICNDKTSDAGVFYFAVALSIIPIIVIYLILSKFIVEGVALGGVKE